MKKWLTDRFLPMWAKETILAENRSLHNEVRRLRQDKEYAYAYIRGMEAGMRAGKKVTIQAGGSRDGNL